MDNGKWHLDKRISVGHLVSTLILTGLLIGGWMEVQGRLIILEGHPAIPAHAETEQRLDNLEIIASTEVARVNAVDAAIQVRLDDLNKAILRQLDQQGVKLDRIEDRLNKHDST